MLSRCDYGVGRAAFNLQVPTSTSAIGLGSSIFYAGRTTADCRLLRRRSGRIARSFRLDCAAYRGRTRLLTGPIRSPTEKRCRPYAAAVRSAPIG